MRANKNKKFETLEAEWDFLNGGGGCTFGKNMCERLYTDDLLTETDS